MPEIEETEEIEEHIVAIRELNDNPGQLNEAWGLFQAQAAGRGDDGRCRCSTCNTGTISPVLAEFINLVNETLDADDCMGCVVCNSPMWQDESNTDVNDNNVCDGCREDCMTCGSCDAWSINRYFVTEVDGYLYCEDCRGDNCSFCDECDRYYRDAYSDDHDHESWCSCSPQELRFKILANSHGELAQDERLLVELAEGHISDEALYAVTRTLWYDQFEAASLNDPRNAPSYDALKAVVEGMDRTWQTKSGNFTRRLSKALFQQLGVKLDPGLLSKAGSTVKAHAGSTNSWHIEFTRDLNQPADAFYNSGSCWWGSEGSGLCALKHWGGLALRTYASATQDRDRPNGRAWVQPLNESLEPTQDVFGAFAYVTYNGYGALEGYAAARLVAYLTSRTYKRITFRAAPQYINSGGYLIADQATCDATTEVNINIRDAHRRVAA